MDTVDWVAQATGGTLHGQAAAFTGVTQDMMVTQDETFGPLARLFKF